MILWSLLIVATPYPSVVMSCAHTCVYVYVCVCVCVRERERERERERRENRKRLKCIFRLTLVFILVVRLVHILYIYTYICIYVYIHIYAYICIYICVWICVYVYVQYPLRKSLSAKKHDDKYWIATKSGLLDIADLFWKKSPIFVGLLCKRDVGIVSSRIATMFWCGSLSMMQVSFRTRATNYSALLREITW